MNEAEIAGYRFKNEALLRAALTHASYQFDHPDDKSIEDFERLEFLGDAVLNFVVAEDLYRRFRRATEGDLTEKRASVVSRVALAEAAERMSILPRTRIGKTLSGAPIQPGLASRFFEAVVGAVFLDGGLKSVRDFVHRELATELAQAARRSPKSVLQETAQQRRLELPVYSQVEKALGAREDRFTYEVEFDGRTAKGAGRSVKEAQEAAAAALLREVE